MAMLWHENFSTGNTNPAEDHIPDLTVKQGVHDLILLCNFMELIVPTSEVPSIDVLDINHISLFVEARRKTRELISWFDKTYLVSFEGEELSFTNLCYSYQASQAQAIRKGIREWDQANKEGEEQFIKAKRKSSNLPLPSRAEVFYHSLQATYPEKSPFWIMWDDLEKKDNMSLIWDVTHLVIKSKGVDVDVHDPQITGIQQADLHWCKVHKVNPKHFKDMQENPVQMIWTSSDANEEIEKAEFSESDQLEESEKLEE
ncbi:hypothetical protein AX16_008514 [Volvariella volvacea WC 439]|nr:hypothetical protein AX16_008514 [Volvariella volvacea WC 439]